ncbi:PAS domain S-box protein, partial [bacterium]|nr:PAS domain S-box protein [bacterium]
KGDEFITALQKSELSIPPFIVTTGQGDEHIAVAMMKLGAKDYLIKNTHFLEILPEVIKRVSKEIENEDKLKQAEEALKESEEKFKIIFENKGTATGIVAEDGVIRECNAMFAELSGYPRSDLVGKMKWSDFVVKEDLARLQKYSKQRFENGEAAPTQYECGIVNRNGEVQTAIVNVAMHEKDRIVSLLDITERKQAEEKLMKSETLYRELVESMIDGLYKTTHEGRFLEVNQAMVKILGYNSKEELMAVDIKKELYFNEADREDITSTELQKVTDIYQLRKKDGSAVWVEDNGRYVFSDEGDILYHEGVLRDITERKQIEEALRHNEEMILSSQSVANICSYSTNL